MAKILLVEDDQFIADIYKKKFETSGFEVVNVISGRSVLKIVEEQKFDLILLDLVIPELSGMEVLKELRSPKYDPNLRIVIFSNLSNPEEREQAVRLGANGFISKTEFSPSQVVDEINRYLKMFAEQGKNEVRRSENGANGTATEKKKRILFIEDEEVFVDMFGDRLKNEGYEVISENNGSQGIERAFAESFDLIITDAMLPGAQGKEIIGRLKVDDRTKQIPIFVISASLDEEDMRDMLSAGATLALQKTKITPSDLVDKVEEFFK